MTQCGLTFDWDNITFEDERVQDELNWLCEEFGDEVVWYRVSSSGNGLHVMIAEMIYDESVVDFKLVPLNMSTEQQLSYREKTSIECKGRFFSDMLRKKAGLRTSRIFNVKNGNKVGKWRRFK